MYGSVTLDNCCVHSVVLYYKNPEINMYDSVTLDNCSIHPVVLCYQDPEINMYDSVTLDGRQSRLEGLIKLINHTCMKEMNR